MTILLLIILYAAIGAVFAWRMAISMEAIIILIIAWPIFAVLLMIAPIINWWVNREFRKDDNAR